MKKGAAQFILIGIIVVILFAVVLTLFRGNSATGKFIAVSKGDLTLTDVVQKDSGLEATVINNLPEPVRIMQISGAVLNTPVLLAVGGRKAIPLPNGDRVVLTYKLENSGATYTQEFGLR